MTDRSGRPQGSPPPSFSPQGAGASRPSSDDGAVPVGGANGPVTHVPARPTRRPTTGGTPRATRSGEPAGRPASVPPRTTSSGRPSAEGARPTGTSQPGTGPRGAAPSGAAAGGAAGPRRTVSSTPGGARPTQRPAAARPGDAPPASVRPVASRPSPARAAAAGPLDLDGDGPEEGGSPSHGFRLRPGRIAAVVAVLALVGLIAWPVGLGLWANGKITHVAALSGAAATDGTTYLLAGSDSREDGAIHDDGTAGARTDTIMLLHVPADGPNALISLPRDTFVEIAGHGGRKLNASYAYGGPELLVSTVEGLTGLTVDHYVEIGLGGVKGLVDAVGGVNLCLDYKVRDKRSGLKWNPGCHDVDGKKALAFVRMRYADPKGDLGRAERQRQLIGAVTKKAANFGTVINPGKQVDLIDAGLGAIAADDGTGITDLGRLALAFRAATGEGGVTGTPPVANVDYRPGGGAGSTVLLDPDTAPAFWDAVRDGSLEPGRYDGDGRVEDEKN